MRVARVIRLAALVVALAVIGAACLGGGNGGTPHPVSAQPGYSPLAEDVAGGGIVWTVRASVGYPAGLRSKLPPCPAGATCIVRRFGSETFGDGSHPWIRISTRRFTCPLHGTDDSADCHAIGTLRYVLKHRPPVACSCPLEIGLRPTASARIGGRDVTVPLDFCTYCDRSPTRSEHALRVLLPPTPPA